MGVLSVIRLVTRLIVAGILLVLVAGLALFAYNKLFNPWAQPPETIEAFLRSQTPLGMPANAVQEWLAARGAHHTLVEAQFGPGDVYPMSNTGGATFIQAVVKQHQPWLIQQEYVVAFYSFDKSGTLTDISVRIDRDGP